MVRVYEPLGRFRQPPFQPFSPAEAGSRVGMVIMFTMLGMALGGWMSGKVYDLSGSYQAAFINGIAWNLLNLTIAITLWRKVMRRPPGNRTSFQF